MYKIFDTQLNKWTDHNLISLCDMHMLDDFQDPDFKDNYEQDYKEYKAGKWNDKNMIKYIESRGYEVYEVSREGFEKLAYNMLDKEGFIPTDWIIHDNGDIEHKDEDNYLYGFVPLETVLLFNSK